MASERFTIMAKPGLAQDQTVEEILASIRQVINGEQSRSGTAGARPVAVSRPAASSVTAFRSGRTATTSDELSDSPAGTVVEQAPVPADDRAQMHDVIQMAIEQALDNVSPEDTRAEKATAGPARDGGPSLRSLPRPKMEPLGGREPARSAETLPRPLTGGASSGLLSPRANAAVAASFDELARALDDRGAREIDQVVEDLLRPMLKRWLEDNLPSLVERLVREEIERVSRGRR